MYFQKSDTTILVEDFLLEQLWSLGCVHAIIFLTEHKQFYEDWISEFFVDSTSLLIFNLWKEVYFFNSAQKRNTHNRNMFGIENKVNIRKSADGRNLLRKSGNLRLFATSYRELSSFMVRLCAFIV